jgi:hypothetical protein
LQVPNTYCSVSATNCKAKKRTPAQPLSNYIKSPKQMLQHSNRRISIQMLLHFKETSSTDLISISKTARMVERSNINASNTTLDNFPNLEVGRRGCCCQETPYSQHAHVVNSLSFPSSRGLKRDRARSRLTPRVTGQHEGRAVTRDPVASGFKSKAVEWWISSFLESNENL